MTFSNALKRREQRTWRNERLVGSMARQELCSTSKCRGSGISLCHQIVNSAYPLLFTCASCDSLLTQCRMRGPSRRSQKIALRENEVRDFPPRASAPHRFHFTADRSDGLALLSRTSLC